MSKRVSVTLSDAMFDAVLYQARNDGQGTTRGNGKDYVIRKALRAWLNQNRFSAIHLDMDDESYAEWLTTHPDGLPHARKNNTPALPDTETMNGGAYE